MIGFGLAGWQNLGNFGQVSWAKKGLGNGLQPLFIHHLRNSDQVRRPDFRRRMIDTMDDSMTEGTLEKPSQEMV
jgi:hypothetical protein